MLDKVIEYLNKLKDSFNVFFIVKLLKALNSLNA